MIEAKIGALHGDEAAHHQVGADQQAEAERHLRDGERGLQALAARGPATRRGRLLQIVDEIRPRRAQRWQQPDGERREERRADRECDDGAVDAEDEPVRQFFRERRDHPVHCPLRGQQAHRGARNRQQHALGERRPQQARAARAHRRADRELALPRCASHQHQVGEVGAHDQQHEPDRRHQHHADAIGAGVHVRTSGSARPARRSRGSVSG